MSNGESTGDMDPQQDPQHFEELKEAYALNALSGEERVAFERYLAENPAEQPEVEELSSIASLLALASPEQEPPAKLRRNLMSQVHSEAEEAGEADRAGGSQRSGDSAAAGSRREHRGGWTRRLFGARGVVTAAAVAAILGLAVWNISLQSEVSDLQSTEMGSFELQGSGQAEAVQGELVRLGEGRAMLVATNLPELPEDKTYEMWSIEDGDPNSCGVFKAGEEPTIKPITQTTPGAQTFAVTVEPKGGSEQPTTDPIITADLTSKT